jgi:copper(I)-binding protein
MHAQRTLRTRTSAHVLPLVLPLVMGGAFALAGCSSEDEARAIDSTSTTTSASPSAAPSTPAAEQVSVEDPWVRATTDTADPSMSAAFMVLDNDSDATVTVTGARSEVAGTVEIHEMAVVDGQMVMRRSEGGIVLAPRQGQVLQPGGLHVMLMDLQRELAPGDEVGLTLLLDDGSEVTLDAPVKAFVEEEGHYHEPGTPSDHQHS